MVPHGVYMVHVCTMEINSMISRHMYIAWQPYDEEVIEHEDNAWILGQVDIVVAQTILYLYKQRSNAMRAPCRVLL